MENSSVAKGWLGMAEATPTILLTCVGVCQSRNEVQFVWL